MKNLSKRSLAIGVSLLLISGAVTLKVLAEEFKGRPILENLQNADPRWVIPGLLAMVFYCLSEAVNLRRVLRLSGNRPRLRDCVRYSLTGFFFSSITPSATGGQPAQLYMMNRGGIHLSSGAFSLLAGVICFQISAVFLGICGAVYVGQAGTMQSSGLLLLFVIGFTVNALWLGILLCLMFSERSCGFAEKILRKTAARFGKDENAGRRVTEALAEYKAASAMLRSEPLVFIKMAATSMLQMLLYNSIPFFCAKALGMTEALWLPCTFIQSMLFVSVSSLPLPGASGVTEGGFAVLFASQFSGDALGSLLILSRTISFILPLILSGAAVLLTEGLSIAKKRGAPV